MNSEQLQKGIDLNNRIAKISTSITQVSRVRDTKDDQQLIAVGLRNNHGISTWVELPEHIADRIASQVAAFQESLLRDAVRQFEEL